MSYVGRFAPSPTGLMHLGVARSLLAAWLDARRNGGQIVLRIEDLDRPRVIAGGAESLIEDMTWLGLDFDQGPVFQSQREAHYESALARLAALNRIYPCTCSRKDLAASAPHGPADEGPRYPGTCRSGASPKAGRNPALRLRTEASDQVAHDDLLYGRIDEAIEQSTGDFVVRRADGLWAYQLAVVVDDLLQGVTRIVRGADLLSSTPRQILLRRLLDPISAPIETLHLPLIRDAEGKRLAKRDGAAGIASRRARGERPEQIIGLLASTLGLVPAGTSCSALELIPEWDIVRLSRFDSVFPDSGLTADG